jgi:hypothetical protein
VIFQLARFLSIPTYGRLCVYQPQDFGIQAMAALGDINCMSLSNMCQRTPNALENIIRFSMRRIAINLANLGYPAIKMN